MSRELVDYRVLQRVFWSDLRGEVLMLAAGGYELVGGTFMNNGIFCQTVVKYNDTPSKIEGHGTG